MVTQIIQLRYNDLKSLEHELRKLFPNGDFTVDVQMGEFVLTLPQTLSQAQVDDINSKQRHYQRPLHRGHRER